MKKIFFLTSLSFLLFACAKEQKTNTTLETTADTTRIVTKDNTQKIGYEIGDEATDFKLQNINDKYVSLTDYPEAKGFIIIFTCNHCPYAKAYEDRIIAINQKYAPLGYPVIAINPNNPDAQPQDSFEEMKIRAKQKGFNFPYLFDLGQEIYPQYGATKTPHVFILNKENNKNIVKYIGAIDNNYSDANDVTEYYVEDAVNALLEGKSIKTSNTVAIGCSIKTI